MKIKSPEAGKKIIEKVLEHKELWISGERSNYPNKPLFFEKAIEFAIAVARKERNREIKDVIDKELIELRNIPFLRKIEVANYLETNLQIKLLETLKKRK